MVLCISINRINRILLKTMWWTLERVKIHIMCILLLRVFRVHQLYIFFVMWCQSSKKRFLLMNWKRLDKNSLLSWKFKNSEKFFHLSKSTTFTKSLTNFCLLYTYNWTGNHVQDFKKFSTSYVSFCACFFCVYQT